MRLSYLWDKVDKLTKDHGVDLKTLGLSRFGLLVDLLANHVIYGSNTTEYFIYKFYNLNHRGKKNYFAQWEHIYLMYHVNDMKCFDLFEDKRQFADRYQKYMGRITCDLAEGEEAYRRFLAENPAEKYIFKPAGGCCGQGIFVLSKESEKLQDYSWLVSQGEDMVAEPFLENCEQLKKLYPGTLNTLRVCTLRKDGKPFIAGSYLRMGRAGRETDNFSAGGILAEVDKETGVVITNGVDKKGKKYIFHPDSGQQISGLQIPTWEEVKSLVLEVADIAPEVIYSSWDVAVLPNGPVLIEGNIGGDVDLQQAHGEGKRAIYAPYLPKRRWLHFGFEGVMKPFTNHKKAMKTK